MVGLRLGLHTITIALLGGGAVLSESTKAQVSWDEEPDQLMEELAAHVFTTTEAPADTEKEDDEQEEGEDDGPDDMSQKRKVQMGYIKIPQGIDPDFFQSVGDKITELKNPPMTISGELKIAEANYKCLELDTVANCMERLGSYGVRRLQEFDKKYLEAPYNWFNHSDWMSHPNVQKQRLYNITFPGSHNSASSAFTGEYKKVAYSMSYGIQSQKHSLTEQWNMGIRYFDIGVGWSFREKRVYAAYGILMVPLDDVLKEIYTLIERHTTEVLIISLRMAANVGKFSEQHIQPFLDNMDSNKTVPGEMVHLEVRAKLGRFIATYSGLSFLDVGDSAQNPTIESLVGIDRRIVYFWEGQQVLCYDLGTCKFTPGWLPPAPGYPLAFGPPLANGERRKYFQLDKSAKKGAKHSIIDPGCIHRSYYHTESSQPEKLLRHIDRFTKGLREDLMQEPLTTCVSPLSEIEEVGAPPVFYEATAIISLTPAEQVKQQQMMSGKQRMWRSGEAYTASSDAERVNFLLLTWLMAPWNKGSPHLRPNIFTTDFVNPVIVERIIHGVQGRPECGYALFCKTSGSCWARNLLDGWKDNCIDERLAQLELQWMSGDINAEKVAILCTPIAVFMIGCVLYCACLTTSGLVCCPKVHKTPTGVQITWRQKAKPNSAPAAPPAAPAPAAAGAEATAGEATAANNT